MKKLFIVFVLFGATTLLTNAQDYKKFKVGIGLGVAFPPPVQAVDVITTLEPMYRLSDAIAIGFRFENVTTEDIYSSEKANSSYTLSGQYYLSDFKFRPFLGVGFGLYAYNDLGGKFGFYPKVGFDVGHFSMSLDYNLILLPNSIDLEFIRDDYLGIRVGFFIGGGKK